MDYAALLAELDREAEARARAYPGMVDKGRMTKADADHRCAILAEIRGDVAAKTEIRAPAPGAFRWKDKLAELDREIELRDRVYPEWVGKGRMTQADADRQRGALEAVRSLYWDQMLAWELPEGTIWLPWDPTNPASASPAAVAGRDAVRAHVAMIEAAATPTADLFAEA